MKTNLTNLMSILSEEREVGAQTLAKYDIMPGGGGTAITHVGGGRSQRDYDKEITWLASAVLELRKEVNELKECIHQGGSDTSTRMLPAKKMVQDMPETDYAKKDFETSAPAHTAEGFDDIETAEEIVDADILNLEEMERRNIVRALERNNHRRGRAAEELGISERTLYRKIKEYGIE